ncbi:N-acetylmuramoyl-L-alanine amidase [Paenibacillus melissococcoides]|uniref:N-acetylmuramoyl-L-alanine amidase n=1 Tax=Paenibacillus melissococcoides TaxID=2912268 RepID=A0ABN8U530_9BACL|nr:N-acetylmuramoyl-L-alanine amidase [Paenibacillus melissococcoides]CAH8246061.1 N-acetylmuramoyl-L-alanine amidase [Paenibacillus melissococcoides]CAH8713625.1 N-acetylmuramoyl-L-alanine amidase [Paenibacillus melissococcoides]
MYKYIVDHIPRNTPNNRRPGIAMTANTLTVHTTGNPDSSARNERGWLTNPENDRTASYHIVIDEYEAIEVLPLNEVAWHAGDGNGDGNRRSIGIEICESGNYSKTLENAVDLIAKMLKERGWGIDRLRRHYDWSGKICPRLMYDGGKWTAWERFKLMIEKELERMEKPKQPDYAGHWAEASIRRVMDSGIMNGRGNGFAPNEPITRAEIAVVVDRLLKKQG